MAAVLAGGAIGMLLRNKLRGRVDLNDKVVLITGGSRGLGLLMAREFASCGARIAVCAREKKELQAVRDEFAGKSEVFTSICDVSDAEQVQRMVDEVFAHYGQIDILVNNAGIIQVGPFESMSEKDIRDSMNVNYWGTVQATYAALPYLRRNPGARIVNITSIGGVVAVPHLLPYVPAKFASVGFSGSLNVALRKEGIAVTTVIPWLMRTGSFGQALFKGKRDLEMTLFSLSASLPGLTVSAERAARQIVSACRRGQPVLTIGFQAKAARVMNALFPNLVSDILAQIDRALPRAEGDQDPGELAEPGWWHRTGLARSRLTALGDRAAKRNNEKLTHTRRTRARRA